MNAMLVIASLLAFAELKSKGIYRLGWFDYLNSAASSLDLSIS